MAEVLFHHFDSITHRKKVSRWERRYKNEGEVGLDRKLGGGRPRELEVLEEAEPYAILLQLAFTCGEEADR